ncbi:unnamed protein product [Meloidogyne enterolobii]|uniref:Uncharacterized protein n=2 Tax=Meloidogyne enterolobii TaxID=390850 RepID=A0ACB1B7T6_MELEN
MTVVPSDINLITNKLSTIDKVKDNEMNENIVKESGNDKENIIEESGGYSLLGNDNTYYVQLYNKFWPYRALKIINWFLLLLLAVGSVVTERNRLIWSDTYWASGYRYNDNIDGSFASGQVILAVFGLITLIVHCIAKKLFKAAMSSLMDMCFFIFSVPILIVSTIMFSSRSMSLYHWLHPKLANFNYTFEAYVDLTEAVSYPSLYHKIYRPMEKDEEVLERIQRHKREIIINVLINPTFVVLTAITIILNIFLIFCLYKKMRNAKLWNDGVKDYLASLPKRSPIETKYAHLGKTKMFQWFLPLFFLLAHVYMPFFRKNRIIVKQFWSPTIIYFIHWLLYYTTLHLRYPKGQTDKAIRLSTLFITDLILSYFLTLLFVVNVAMEENPLMDLFFMLVIIFYGLYSLKLSFIYLRNKKGSFNFKLPTSIKINFQINLKSDEEKNKVIEEKLEEGDEKKEENDEKKEKNEK